MPAICSNIFPKIFESISKDYKENLLIDIARPQEAEEISAFLYKFLHCASPIVHINAFNPTSEELKERKTFILENTRCCLKDLLSLIVRKGESGQIVAIRINKLERWNQTAEGTKSLISNPPKPNHLLYTMLESLKDGYDLFKLYGTDKVLHLCGVAVHPSLGRQGLASELYSLSIDLAASSGAGAIAVVCASKYTIRALTKFGLITHSKIDYASYEYQGVRPLAGCSKLLADHSEARFMSSKLP